MAVYLLLVAQQDVAIQIVVSVKLMVVQLLSVVFLVVEFYQVENVAHANAN
jgi:hypothetical protein